MKIKRKMRYIDGEEKTENGEKKTEKRISVLSFLLWIQVYYTHIIPTLTTKTWLPA